MINMVKMPLKKEWGVVVVTTHLTYLSRSLVERLVELLGVMHPSPSWKRIPARGGSVKFLFCFSYRFGFLWLKHLSALVISGGGSFRGSRKKQGEDIVHTLRVSLEDLYNGTTKKLSLSRNILCPKCKGYFSFFNYMSFFHLLLSVALCSSDFK